ncbi:MAG: cysteine dioxygenase [Burkholderiales bacterium]
MKTQITQTLKQARAIEARSGISRQALEEMKTLLLKLAAQKQLFPAVRYAVPAKGSVFYALHEAQDGRYGLYLNVAPAGNQADPHCHGTWAVAVGIRGEEQSRFYKQDGAALIDAGEGRVAPGLGICMLAQDIHSVAVTGGEPTLHLHLYGLDFAHFPELAYYDLKTGAARHVPPPVPVYL